nr:protein kinase [Rhabdochlamydiaceae bacterium]
DGSMLAQKLRGQKKTVKSAILVEAAKELLQGVIGMQKKHINHFDLKPTNFMFDMKGTLYIVDFGSAIKLEQGILKEPVRADAYYFSPEGIELFRQELRSISAEKSESWSIGVSLLEMIKGYNCFMRNDEVFKRNEFFFKEILEQELQDIDAPEVIAQIIRGLLIINPNERMSALDAYGKIRNISSFRNAEEKASIFASMKGLEQD